MRSLRPTDLVTRPTVTVVVPCYNYGHFLPACVAGVLAQPGVDLEVIVVDDCSTDGSQAVAADLAASDPRITLVQHETNRGHIATYNDGLRRATGDYVVLLSADDLLPAGSLARSAALLEANPDVVLCYGHVESFLDEPPVAVQDVRSWSVWDGEEWVRRVCRRGRNIIVNPEAMLRREVMDELGGYEVDHPHAADMKLWMRAALRGGVGRVNGATQAFYREHGANMHSTVFAGVLTDLSESRRVFETFLTEEDLSVGLRGELDELSRRGLAREALILAGVAQASGGAAGAEAPDLASFASATRPAVVDSVLWRSYLRRSRGRFAPGERALLAQAHRVRWIVRWRRWRRWGT